MKSPMPQFWPQQCEAPQVDWTGQAGSFAPELVWAAGALKFLVKSVEPQDGHPGFASPVTSSSNSFPHVLQEYS
jgi:hypothetical protein